MYQFAPAVGDKDHNVQRLERERGHGEQVGGPQMVIGSKDGALRHYCRTFPSSALRTGQATCRCTQLASNVLSPSWLSSPSVRVMLLVAFQAEKLNPLLLPGCNH